MAVVENNPKVLDTASSQTATRSARSMAAWTSHGNDFATRTEPLFRNNLEGYPFYRIPSLLAINASLLLAFAEARASAPTTVTPASDEAQHGRRRNVVAALSRKRRGPERHDWQSGAIVRCVGGFRRPLLLQRERREIYSTRSSDFGDSWSVPQTIAWSRPADWQWVATGPPAALVTTRGQWVLPCRWADRKLSAVEGGSRLLFCLDL